VANTTETLLLGDLETFKLSEVPWQYATTTHTNNNNTNSSNSSSSEKFIFENAAAALVFSAGELTVVEYGSNEVLGAVRTDHTSGYLLSIRLNERPPRTGSPDDPDTPRADDAAGQVSNG
jgi:intraflagellar transport protein 172